MEEDKLSVKDSLGNDVVEGDFVFDKDDYYEGYGYRAAVYKVNRRWLERSGIEILGEYFYEHIRPSNLDRLNVEPTLFDGMTVLPKDVIKIPSNLVVPEFKRKEIIMYLALTGFVINIEEPGDG